MHRFHLPPAQCQADRLLLSGAEAHHAIHVLRLRRGDRVTVLNGAGLELLCEVEAIERNQPVLALVEKRSHPPLPCQITLLQAIPKGKLIESIIQKATELGAARVVPLLAERVVTRLDSHEAAAKAAKWQAIAVEAVKQCGAPWLPRVETPLTPTQFLARKEPFDLALVGSLQAGAKHPREYVDAYRAAHGRFPQTACVWIGPEGDFTLSELGEIQAAGALPITLGPLVLRTDTAALYSLSFLNYEAQSQIADQRV
jgi:16S rRNA (uracil1498-N3)-methyltransferase